jgi:hypothetical protein
MKVYHYTSFSKIGDILGKRIGETSGLKPRRRIGLFSPSLDNPRATFGLLEPTPDNWVNNPHFPATWRTLVHDLTVMGHGALLLEADVESKKDRAFVGERAHLEGILYSEKGGIPSEFIHEEKSQAEKAFMDSLVPTDEYVAGEMGYSLPEVVILNTVPLEKIIVSSQQPLIEEDLTRTRSEDREYLVHLITDGRAKAELTPWRTTYEARNGFLEQSYRRKETF